MKKNLLKGALASVIVLVPLLLPVLKSKSM